MFPIAGYLVSVFDGHGGVQCARALARRLPSYVAAGLAGAAAPWPLAQLTPQDQQQPPPVQLQRLLELQFQQFRASVEHLHDDPDRVRLALEAAFEALDHQIGEEALAFLIGPDMAQVMGEVSLFFSRDSPHNAIVRKFNNQNGILDKQGSEKWIHGEIFGTFTSVATYGSDGMDKTIVPLFRKPKDDSLCNRHRGGIGSRGGGSSDGGAKTF